MWLFVTSWISACHASLSISNSWSSPKLICIELVMPFSHHALSSSSPPAPNPSQIWDFSNESTLCMRWPKYWSFSFNISPSKNTQDWSPLGWTGLISLQYKGRARVFSNITVWTVESSILWCSDFFIVQLSHPYMTTGKTIALTRWTFVDKVMSLVFNMLSRLVITFLPRSKRLLISWLQSPSAVIFGA